MNTHPSSPSPKREAGPYRAIFDAADDGLIVVDLASGVIVEGNPAACAMHGYPRSEFIGLLLEALIDPSSRSLFGNRWRAVGAGAVFDPQLLHLRRDGSTFHASWRGKSFTHQGRPSLLGIVRDISRRIQAEQRLHKRVEAHAREQAALLEISHALASTLELQPDLVLDQLREIIEYRHAAFFGLTDSTLTALAVRGPQLLERAAPFQVRVRGTEILAALFNGHRPIRIGDVGGADPAAEFLRSLLTGEAAMLLEGVRAWMWVPVAVQGRILGGIGVAHARRNHFTAHHAALALSMADQVAITMANAELYEQARALASLQERQRLARNLHDAVNQSLFSAGLIAEVLPRLWDLDPVAARQSLEDLRRLTRGALAEMRELLAELRPSVLTDSSLGDLLRQLANAFTGRSNIPARVTIAREHVVPAKIQVALYRICQEALNNIAKHAGASEVVIDLQYDSVSVQPSSTDRAAASEASVVRSVEMRIRDDGRGFDATQPTPSGHYGLAMMRERAEAVEARLEVLSRPGHGTELILRWQQPPEQEAA